MGAEFVQLVSSEANDLSEKEKKTTITPEHVLAALEQLGFADFQEDVRAFYGDVKESNAQRGAAACFCCRAAPVLHVCSAGLSGVGGRCSKGQQPEDARGAERPVRGGAGEACPL